MKKIPGNVAYWDSFFGARMQSLLFTSIGSSFLTACLSVIPEQPTQRQKINLQN